MMTMTTSQTFKNHKRLFSVELFIEWWMHALVHSAHVREKFHSVFVNQSVSLSCPSECQPVS